jgi:hypothetical protein
LRAFVQLQVFDYQGGIEVNSFVMKALESSRFGINVLAQILGGTQVFPTRTRRPSIGQSK